MATTAKPPKAPPKQRIRMVESGIQIGGAKLKKGKCYDLDPQIAHQLVNSGHASLVHPQKED